MTVFTYPKVLDNPESHSIASFHQPKCHRKLLTVVPEGILPFFPFQLVHRGLWDGCIACILAPPYQLIQETINLISLRVRLVTHAKKITSIVNIYGAITHLLLKASLDHHIPNRFHSIHPPRQCIHVRKQHIMARILWLCIDEILSNLHTKIKILMHLASSKHCSPHGRNKLIRIKPFNKLVCLIEQPTSPNISTMQTWCSTPGTTPYSCFMLAKTERPSSISPACAHADNTATKVTLLGTTPRAFIR
ncbi:hypothetical protein AAZX31_13G163600 [Glycine max]|nr:hypothetical protein GmHk_13G037984 [Glycine max]